MVAWLAAAAALVAAWATSCWQWRARREGVGRRYRDVIADEIKLMERGIPRIVGEELAALGEDAAAMTARARATRAPRTSASAQGLAASLRRFVEANPRILSSRPPTATSQPLAGEHWDMLVEAWLLTRCEPQSSPWRPEARATATASAAGGGRDPKAGGTVRSLIDRLGYSRGTAWPRAKAMAKSLGVGDTEGVVHAEPVFAWEVAECLLRRPPTTLWESAAAAMVVLGTIAARRVSGACGLLVEQVTVTGPSAVTVAPRHRPKQMRERVGRRRTAARPVRIEHWMVQRYVIPWINWHARRKSAGNGYLFPSITQKARSRPSTLGFAAGNGMWVEPLRRWSSRAVRAAMERCVGDLGTRSYQGLRAGNNIELRRAKGVSMITRRSLHERSLKPVMGSEEAYVEIFAEDYCDATRELGKLRIERRRDLLTVTATSESAGRDPADWTPTATGDAQIVNVGGNDDDMSDAAVSGGETDDDDDDDGKDVVGDGGRETRILPCGRCGRVMGARDYGFLCDAPRCKWAACTDCHQGGTSQPLWCPRHLATGR